MARGEQNLEGSFAFWLVDDCKQVTAGLRHEAHVVVIVVFADERAAEAIELQAQVVAC